MFGKFSQFLRDVKSEMKKVSWSTRDELIAATVVTFVFVALLAVYIGIFDFLMSRLMALLIK